MSLAEQYESQEQYDKAYEEYKKNYYQGKNHLIFI